MSPFFDELERDLVRAAEQRNAAREAAPARSRRPRRAALPLVAALVLAVAGTAAGGTYLALRSSSIAPFADEDVTPEQRVEPGTSRVVDLRAADPDRSAPPWALRLSRSGGGLLCTTVGQVRDDEFGLVGLDGVFRGLPEANADACGEEGAMIGTRVFASKRFRDVRTVVNGVAADLERVTMAARGGPPRTVPHSPEGAFVAVLTGYPEDAQPVVTLHRRDGTRRRFVLARDDFVVVDPYGERSWKLEAFSMGRAVEPGKPRPPLPRWQPVCVNFSKARAVPGERFVLSPPVCGLEPGRPDVPEDTLFFHTRRLAGDADAGIDTMRTGDWNDHAPRVAVYGSARGHRRIVVTAPGFRAVAKPKLNGGFLVFLPPRTRRADVAVEVDGRRHGPAFGTIPPRRAL